MLRTLIADEQYSSAWTRVAGSLSSPGVGGTAYGMTSTAAASAPAAASSAPVSGASSGLIQRSTTTTPLTLSTPTVTQVIAANAKRRLLILQNNSSASGASVAPTLYVGFGIQAFLGWTLAIAAGAGFALEVSPPQEAVYVAWGPYTGTPTVVGTIIEGSQLSS